MNTESCAHGRSAPHTALKNLHHSQGGTGRHKCVVCAYSFGFDAGIAQKLGISAVNKKEELERCNQGSLAPTSVLARLPDYQAGVGRHKCAICSYEQGYKDGFSQQQLEPKNIPLDIAIHLQPFPDVDDESLSVKEGRSKWVQHLTRERNPKIVNAKKSQVLKATGRLKCEICEFDFEKRYGALGRGFCEVHHKQPLSTLNQQVETKLDDLAILCSNCHRMIHRTKPIMSITDFRNLLSKMHQKGLG